MRRQDLLIAPLLFAACSDNLLHLDYPPAGGGSMILALSTEQGVRLEAISLSPAPSRITLQSDDQPQYLEALIYDQTLSELGLPSGAIEPVDQGSPLPAPRVSYRAEND